MKSFYLTIFLIILNGSFTYSLSQNAPTPTTKKDINNSLKKQTTTIQYLFRIQLGTYKNPELSSFQNLALIGATLYTELLENKSTRILVGDYYSRKEAEHMLPKLKAKGYPDAFVVREDIPMESSNEAAEPSQTAPTNDTSMVYVIQLGAYGSVNFDHFLNLMDLGELYSEEANKLIKVYIGKYFTAEEAQQKLASIKVRGYPAAFIRRMAANFVE